MSKMSFQKRQKEMKRQEKRQMKAEKRAQRKLERNVETAPQNESASDNQQPVEEMEVSDRAV